MAQITVQAFKLIGIGTADIDPSEAASFVGK